MLVQTEDMKYTLAEFGESLETMDIFTGDICQVDLKEMSEFEQSVYLFLIANKE